MTTLKTPAPLGAPGIDYGNTTVKPYRPGRPHKGKDWQWRRANPIASRTVVAGVSGTVIAAHNDGAYREGWGNYVDILIPSTTHRIVRRLAHHATGTVLVRVGQTVGDDTRIGTMGDTGESPGGVHLHEELWINGERVDPTPYYTRDLPGTTGTPAGKGEPITNQEEDDMYTDADRARDERTAERVNAVYAAVFGARNLTGKRDPVRYVDIDGRAKTANYGLLDIVTHNQTLIAQRDNSGT